MKKLSALFLCLVLSLSIVGCGTKEEPLKIMEYGNVVNAKNVILLIGDGMGPEQIKAGSICIDDGYLFMESMPNKVNVETKSADNTITDSAAAGTALATGKRTNNGVVAMTPDGGNLTTIIDLAKNSGKRTGVVTTEKISGATPMAFSAHATSRNNTSNLLNSAASSGNVNLFISDDNSVDNGNGTLSDQQIFDIFTGKGYAKIETVDGISECETEKVIGRFPITASAASMSDYSFDRIVKESIEYLSKDEDGFFLMAEGGHIDHRCHHNDLPAMIDELLAFDLGVKYAVEWAKNRTDTVVIITADHETGGLTIEEGAKDRSSLIDDNKYSWKVGTHTGVDVYMYLYGKKMDYTDYGFESKERIMNTDVFKIMKEFIAAA